MSALPIPAWAQTDEARALLVAIRIERPEPWFVRRNAWVNGRQPKYRGANARALRVIWEAATELAMSENDHAAYARLANHEHPDDLIEALLNEQTVPWTPVRFDTDPETGRARFAA